MELTITNTFVSGTTIRSAEANENFADVVTWANGNIGADNLDTFIEGIDFNLSSVAYALNITANSSAAAISISQAGSGSALELVQTSNNQAIAISQSGDSQAIDISQSGNAAGLRITHSGGASDSNKAALEIASTTKGYLGPRMTSTQRDAITSPSEGLEIYNTTEHRKEVYNGTEWIGASRLSPVKYLSSASGISSTSSETYASIANQSISSVEVAVDQIVELSFQPDPASDAGGIFDATTAGNGGRLNFLRDGVPISGNFGAFMDVPSNNTIPAGAFRYIDTPSPGTYTYSAEFRVNAAGSGATFRAIDVMLVAMVR